MRRLRPKSILSDFASVIASVSGIPLWIINCHCELDTITKTKSLT
jgi:hypothetical protein